MTAVILNMNNSDGEGETGDERVYFSGEETTPHKRCLRCGDRILTGKEDCCRRCAGPSADEIYDKGIKAGTWGSAEAVDEDEDEGMCWLCKGSGRESRGVNSGGICSNCDGSGYF